MIPEHIQRLALAALLHDLPELAQQADRVPPGARRVCDLASLADPAAMALVRQAEALVLGGTRALAADRPLRSIFSRVALGADEPPQAWHTLAPLAAAADRPRWLAPAAVPAEQPRGAYLAAMFKALDSLAAHADLGSFETAHAHLLAWLDRYGRCLPAHQDDVALCDHARLTSAVAVCLAQSEQNAPAEQFCLVAGKLVGAAGYCLAAATQPNELAQLHARSLYLAALSAALEHEAAERLTLPLGTLLGRAGGQFYLLAPNTPATAAALAGIEQELNAWLRQASTGALALALAHVTLGAEQLQPSAADRPGFGTAAAALHAAIERASGQPARAALADAGGWREDAFVFREHSYAEHAPCAACGQTPGSQAAGLCPHCARDKRLVPEMARVRYLAFYRGAAPDAIALTPGRSFRALAEIDPRDRGEPYLVIKLNDPSIDELADLPGAFRYTAGRMPLADDSAEQHPAARQAHGQALLGYMQLARDRADAQIVHGLRRPAAGYDSAAHVIGLQRELDLLGTGWLQQLLSQPRYAAFTALDLGDELLLAGPWNQAAHLAIELRAQLSRCTGYHPGITCSAGLLFAKAQYPLARAAADTRATLAQARARPTAGERHTSGDQLALLGDTLRWTDTPQVFDEIARLHQHGQSISAPLLRDLIEYGRRQRLWSEEQQAEGLRYKALFVYNIARALRRSDIQIYRWADELMQSLHTNSQSLAVRHLELIATYLLLLRRDE